MKSPLLRVAFWMILLAVTGYGVMTLRGPRGIAALREKGQLIEAMEKRNAGLALQVERKRDRNKRLAENPAEQELEIRKQYKLVRPGEKMYVTGDPENR